jgi:hypothetical protein
MNDFRERLKAGQSACMGINMGAAADKIVERLGIGIRVGNTGLS